MKHNLLSIGLLAMLLLSVRGYAQTTYTMVNSASGLVAGEQYLLVGFDDDGNAYAMSYQKSNNRHAISVSETGGVITATVATDPQSQDEAFEITLGGAAGAWTLFDALNNGYLYAPGGGNYLKTQTDLTDNGKWTIEFDANGGTVPTSNGGIEQCYMHFNLNTSGTPLFGCYKSTSSVVAPVYFFKAGGQAEPDPEPSNYPSNFAAQADGLSVTLTWNDATGEQLPSKYLVVASTGDITVPTDGTPVANGAMAVNVNYGKQTATFYNLNGNTTYHFAIFPYTNAGANIDYKTDGAYPTATVTTADLHVLLNEQFESSLGAFTVYDVYGDQTWEQRSYNNNGYGYMSGYANEMANENEDWLISPRMDGNFASIKMSFSTAMKFDGEPLQVMISEDYEGGEPSDYTWTNITDMFDFSTGDYTWVESGEVNITNYTGESFCIAFVYNSTSEAASTWEVDNVMIMAQQPVSVAENATMVSVCPNPAIDVIAINLAQDAEIGIYDMSGRKVASQQALGGTANCSIANLESGVYFLHVRYVDGTVAVSKFVKQ